MSKTVIEVLKEARSKVAQGWCQGPCAVNADGMSVPPESAKACKWCVYGALEVVAGEEPDVRRMAELILDKEANAPAYSNCVGFNEYPGRTQAEVLDLFDRAIEKAGTP